ncbi:MAG: hypothetical protein NBV77_08240 [Bacteroidia bacterium]|nr:hypothetical protein [Bacteroidia bacterium]
MSMFKNSKGSVPVSCGCKSAIEHWERNSNRKAVFCSVKGCTKQAEHGGHIINCHGNASNKQYIVPLCTLHNHSSFSQSFTLNKIIEPIPVGKLHNCK